MISKDRKKKNAWRFGRPFNFFGRGPKKNVCQFINYRGIPNAHRKSALTLESLFRLFDLMLTSVEKADSHKYAEENSTSTCKALHAS